VVEDWIQSLAQWPSHYSYLVLFLIVFAENVGVPVPGETMVLGAGMLASRPDASISVVGVILVTITAAILGDNLGFWLGRRWARGRIERGGRFLFLTPKALEVVEGYFHHYGSLTVFFARFVTGLRVVAALAAGTSTMSWSRFLLANSGGAIAWATCMTLLGFFGGHSWQTLHKWLGRGGLVVVASVVLLIGIPYLWKHMRRLPSGSWERLLRSQVLTGLLAAVLVTICLAGVVFLARQHALQEDDDLDLWAPPPHFPWVDMAARGGSYLGSLPVTVGFAVVVLAWLRLKNRSWRESVALLAALLGSESIGLLLLAWLRHQHIEPARAFAWPFGFAGLAPLRGAAAYGMMAYLLARLDRSGRILFALTAVAIVSVISFSVVWSKEQRLTEVLIELVAGSLVLFVGFYWLEGVGLAPRPGPPEQNANLAAPSS
jgi:membrane protein DedA with SNARE-associated domain